MNKLDTLYKRDKTGKKILVAEIELGIVSGYGEQQGSFFAGETAIVTRTTGFIDGKKQKHTDTITQGKQNRTVLQQAELEAKSHWNSKRDEGYKTLLDLGIEKTGDSYWYNTPTRTVGTLETALITMLPEERTDASGVLKPMKCTALNDNKNNSMLTNVLKKIKFPAYAQPKLDGVRCFAHKVEEGDWKFTSSSGKSYDVVCRYILEELNKLNFPIGTILDGELYIHGTPLQKISGWCRKETPIEEHKQIQYWIFDTAEKEIFTQRLRTIAALAIETSTILHLTPTIVIHNKEEIQEWHDKYVERGYEGLIIRNFDGKYAYGIRSSEIFKYKGFQDAEFMITNYILGKRGSFDMVFCMMMEDGKTFEAKPLGDAATKEEYVRDFPIIQHKMGTVRFLSYSEKGIPQGNTILKCIRDYE